MTVMIGGSSWLWCRCHLVAGRVVTEDYELQAVLTAVVCRSKFLHDNPGMRSGFCVAADGLVRKTGMQTR